MDWDIVARFCLRSLNLVVFLPEFENSRKENEYKSHDEWLKDWSRARSDSFYLAGRASEQSGNNACIFEVLEARPDSLKIELAVE